MRNVYQTTTNEMTIEKEPGQGGILLIVKPAVVASCTRRRIAITANTSTTIAYVVEYYLSKKIRILLSYSEWFSLIGKTKPETFFVLFP